MSNSPTTWKVAGSCFFALSILSLLFGLTMWFLVPPDPMGNIHAVATAKAKWALVGIVVAAVMFFFARYSFRKAIHERSGR
jgi:hypothetical protein